MMLLRALVRDEARELPDLRRLRVRRDEHFARRLRGLSRTTTPHPQHALLGLRIPRARESLTPWRCGAQAQRLVLDGQMLESCDATPIRLVLGARPFGKSPEYYLDSLLTTKLQQALTSL